MHDKALGADGKPGRVRVDAFPVASRLVNALMGGVLAAARADPELGRRLFQANFHTTLSGESMVTLIYHRKLDDAWTAAARVLRTALAALPGAAAPPHVVGRSRKQRVLVEAAEVEEVLEVPGRGALRYRQVEGAFSQPNAGVCAQMLGWAAAATAGPDSAAHDLLELYCGNGNFTAALAPNFRRVVATEVSKSAVAAARYNLEANGITNTFIARMSSEDFAEARQAGRAYERLKGVDLPAHDFGTLFVDPPRAGLDAATRALARDFRRVVYVSCNPHTLARDAAELADLFSVEKFALFDQFPYTHHVECGMVLARRPEAPAPEPPEKRAREAAAAASAAAAEGGSEAAEGVAGGEAAEGGEERAAKRKAEEEAAAPDGS
jgi:tRNA (uracil-5-)-methyltransferase